MPIGNTVYQRPNRFKKTKDVKYHKNYAKWVISNINSSTFHAFITKCLINRAFYKGDQWVFNEDLDPFLLDESGDVRNRIKFVQNTIRPLVEYYRGTAIKMDMHFRAQSITSQAADRRQFELAKSLHLTEVARLFPDHADGIKRSNIVGDNDQETEEMHASMYRDAFDEDINNIVQKIGNDNKIDELKVRIMQNIAIDGIGIVYEEERFGAQVWEEQQARRFFFDDSAKRPDLKDAEYMGNWELTSISDIVELYPRLPKFVLRTIEKSTSFNRTFSALHNFVGFESHNTSGKIPVYKVYWRDIEVDKWGAVVGDFGYPQLVKIDSKDSKWTSRDLVSKKELKKLKDDNHWVEENFCDASGKVTQNVKSIPCDVVRFCHVIPAEYLSESKDDIVLKFGKRRYSQKYSYDKRFPDFPFKAYCWSYDNGEILSPIDDIISPQRFINRVMSMGESQINNTRGSGTIIDTNAVDSQGGEDEVTIRMNQSKPIFIDAGGQVNNAVGQYNSNSGGALQMFQVAEIMKGVAKDVVGGGDALMGQGGAYRASASVNTQNVNQGTVMQEPVFFALDSIMLDIHDSMANRGRRILAGNRRKLAFTVGDKGAVSINLTKEFDIEEFRTKLIRSNSPDNERQYANDMLLNLFQRNLISHKIVAKYYDRSSMPEIGYAMREHAMDLVELERARAKEQEAQIPQAQAAAAAAAGLQNIEQEKQEVSIGQANIEKFLHERNDQRKGLQ